MEGLELDFYIEQLNLAAEVQGEQHYLFVELFHKTKERFEKQLERDARKRIICRERGIKLVEIFTEKDADLFVLSIKDILKVKDGETDKKTPQKKYLSALDRDDLLKTLQVDYMQTKFGADNTDYQYLEKWYPRLKSRTQQLVKITGLIDNDFLIELDTLQRRCRELFDARRFDPAARKEVRKRNEKIRKKSVRKKMKRTKA